MKTHYEECWLEKVLQGDAVELEDNSVSIFAEEDDVHVQLAPNDQTLPVMSVISTHTPTPNTPSLPPAIANAITPTSQKRTLVRNRYVSLSVVKDSAVVCTSDAYAEKIGEQIGRYLFATKLNAYKRLFV